MSTTFIETALAEHERIVIHGPGEVIFHEGDTPRGIYVLRNGSLDLGFASLNGPPRHFRRAEARQLFGLSAVVSHCPHEFSAVTRSVAELGFIEREVFARVLAEQPAIWFAVLRILSTEVNRRLPDDARTRRWRSAGMSSVPKNLNDTNPAQACCPKE